MPTKTKEAPSTAPPNPLAESLARVTGANPFSASPGTSSLINYDPEQSFRPPQGDIINITGDPGTGASTAETWSHEIALENLRREQMQFEYEQQQNALSNALRQQEARRAETQLGFQRAEAGRAAAISPYQLESARLANEASAYDVMPKARAEQDMRNAYAAQVENAAHNRWLGGAAMSPQTEEAWQMHKAQPYNPQYAAYNPQAGYMTRAQQDRSRYGGHSAY